MTDQFADIKADIEKAKAEREAAFLRLDQATKDRHKRQRMKRLKRRRKASKR